LTLACVGFISAQAYGASVSTTMRVSAITISSGSHLDIQFSEDYHLSFNENDPTSLLPAPGAGSVAYMDEFNQAFREDLLTRLKQLSLLSGVAYHLSLKNHSYETWRLFIKNNNPVVFEYFIDSFKIQQDKSPIIISLSH